MTDLPLAPLADQRLRVSRVADQVADRIRELILTGTLADGDRLPRMEVLLRDFGVSAASMREAFRILESEGLITVKRGSTGGAIIHRPDPKTAAYVVALVLNGKGVKTGDVMDCTALLEPACAMLCARRTDRKKVVLPDLRKHAAASRKSLEADNSTFYESMMSFHEVLVQRCGNESLTLLAGILETIWFTKAVGVSTDPRFEPYEREERLKQVESHEQICDLIEVGDDLQVNRVMLEHITVHRVIGGRVDRHEPVSAVAVRNML